MKLFGGTSSKHSAVKKLSESETSGFTPVKTEKTKLRLSIAAFFASMPKTGRTAIITAGAVVVIALIALLGYAIWEKAPDVNADGPKDQGSAAADSESLTGSNIISLPTSSSESEEEPTEEEPEESAEPTPSGRNTDCYTFLLAAYDQYGTSTDTILVGKLDVEQDTLDIVSVPRDTLVNVSWGVKKINTILVSEGNSPEALVRGLSDILGFTVDCYAIVDIEAVEKLVDCIGGVGYEVPRDMHYDDPVQDLHIHIDSGYQWLNGEDVVKVLRFRVGNEGSGYANGDLGRISTQQDFLMDLANQILTVGNIPNLGATIDIFEEYVVTDMSANNIAFFVREFLTLDREEISFHTVPGEGAYIRGGAYYQISVVEWTELINAYLNPYYEEITAENLNVLQFVDSKTGAYSTNGSVVPYDSFYNFADYKG